MLPIEERDELEEIIAQAFKCNSKTAENIEYIGNGQFAAVFRYNNENAQSKVCKIPLEESEQANQKIGDEYDILRSLADIPEIMTVEGVIQTPKRDFLLLEDLSRYQTLEERTRQESYSTRELIETTFQILEALKAQHNKDILHRDLTPFNILVKKENGNTQIKVADFGSAVRLENGSYQPPEGEIEGTPYFMSPSIFLNQGKYTKKAELFQVNMNILYVLARGAHPTETHFKREQKDRFISSYNGQDPINHFFHAAYAREARLQSDLSTRDIPHYEKFNSIQKAVFNFALEGTQEKTVNFETVEDMQRYFVETIEKTIPNYQANKNLQLKDRLEIALAQPNMQWQEELNTDSLYIIPQEENETPTWDLLNKAKGSSDSYAAINATDNDQ